MPVYVFGAGSTPAQPPQTEAEQIAGGIDFAVQQAETAARRIADLVQGTDTARQRVVDLPTVRSATPGVSLTPEGVPVPQFEGVVIGGRQQVIQQGSPVPQTPNVLPMWATDP